MMRILVITRSSWSNNNNIGNTMSNIFSSFVDDDIYGLSFREETPCNDIAIKNFSISEQQIIRFFKTGKKMGKVVDSSSFTACDTAEKNIYDYAKRNGGKTLWFIRELMWCVAPWKNDKLKSYLDEVNPDIVFMPVFGCWYPHKVLAYIKKYTGAKVILFHADDNYTLRQFSFSPIYWLYRFNLRRWVKKSVNGSDLNYAISEIQKREYEKALKKPIKILFKSADFSVMPQYAKSVKPYKFVFTGNISSGRYKMLSLIGKCLQKINENGTKAELDIYTLTPLNEKMQKALDIPGAIVLKGGIGADEVQKVQEEADVLVHVESFDLKNRLQVHQSFSTKIVDYLKTAKCILAVGPKDVASMDYLRNNDAAVTAVCESEIESALNKILEDENTVIEYGKKAWECGVKNHQHDKLQKDLYDDFKRIIKQK